MTSRKNNRNNRIIDNTNDYNTVIEEEEKRNEINNNFHEELNYFENKFMLFGKNKDKSFKLMYIEDYNYCLWLSDNIQDPKYDLLEFIQLVKKYKSPIYTPKNHF